MKVEFRLISNPQAFKDFSGPKLVYDVDYDGDEIFLNASGLLSEDNILNCTPAVTSYQGIKALFPVEKGALPFDPFSAAFYLITRYEEYLNDAWDKHGRYRAKKSIAYKNDFLETPVVNYYAEFIKNLIETRYPDYVFSKRKTSVVSTIDIDNAFAYKNKGFFFHVGSLIKKLLTLKLKRFKEHVKTIVNEEHDPYNSYQIQFDVHQRLGLKAIYFFLVGKNGQFDKNLSLDNKNFKKLISNVAEQNQIGIHPSYGSNSLSGIIKKEKDSLELVLGKEVTASRQHYLRMKLPQTYLTLESIGITEDYTMGYASKIGFRAGICTPYTFYFLGEERESKITVHPFCVMDATLKYYMKVRGPKVLKRIRPLFSEIKKVNGEINVLFHNESIGAKHKWKSWKGLYENILKEALKND